ncbi:(d)CMP kinase [Alphaproteobacteria bacterium]|nr:(d)CMP kinase [Alphaproteobacteria bacterium]MDC0134708.1 (d)CMP kinase [Alphaproteobacteria bacterium]MDC1210111.1 (d)CMP kinase [Pseudomonadota bacterium]
MIEIAIDGTAGSGKGTLGKNLSIKYGYPHLDTGLMFRVVAYNLLSIKKNDLKNLESLSCEFAKSLSFIAINEKKLRSEETSFMASKIAVFPELRNILKLKQIEFSNINKKKYGGCILDGRDIGTVILPNADFKFFITASIEIRAKRRLLEKNISCLQEQNVECMLHSIMKDISRRDEVDKSRLISPLVPAKDAFIIDTSMIDANELMSIVVKIIEGRN